MPIKTEKELYRAREIYPTGDEPARHTIMDRVGMISLYQGRLDHVRGIARFSGHANDEKVSKRILQYFIVGN